MLLHNAPTYGAEPPIRLRHCGRIPGGNSRCDAANVSTIATGSAEACGLRLSRRLRPSAAPASRPSNSSGATWQHVLGIPEPRLPLPEERRVIHLERDGCRQSIQHPGVRSTGKSDVSHVVAQLHERAEDRPYGALYVGARHNHPAHLTQIVVCEVSHQNPQAQEFISCGAKDIALRRSVRLRSIGGRPRCRSRSFGYSDLQTHTAPGALVQCSWMRCACPARTEASPRGRQRHPMALDCSEAEHRGGAAGAGLADHDHRPRRALPARRPGTQHRPPPASWRVSEAALRRKTDGQDVEGAQIVTIIAMTR